MRAEYDFARMKSRKNPYAAKLKKPVTIAAQLEWDDALVWQDTRKEYGEVRMIAFALLDERLYCVVFTDRDEDRRIISLRKANNKEQLHYAKILNAE